MVLIEASELTLKCLRREYPAARIDVILPSNGPLAPQLAAEVDSIRIRPLFVIRRRRIWQTLIAAIASFPKAFPKAARLVAQYDILYVNTSVILDHTH